MGIRGKDFVLVCTDTSAVHSIITIKQDEDKIIPVDSHKVFCIAGEAGDRVQFSDYIIANIKLYSLRNSTSLSTRSVANYTRGELATALRKVGFRVAVSGGGAGVGSCFCWDREVALAPCLLHASSCMGCAGSCCSVGACVPRHITSSHA